MRGWLSEKIPEHVCYVEPFCGAGHLLFSKAPSKVEVLNDTDNHLVNLLQVIRHPEKRQMLMKRLALMLYSRALWKKIRTRWKQGNIPCKPVRAASEFFYLNRLTFSGDQKRGGFAMPSVTGRNPAQSYFNAIDGFEGIAGRLRGVTIECLDYQECIRRYDSPNTLFYCDPPYFGSEHFFGKDFNHKDHHVLAKLLHEVTGKAMVSHYANGLYDKLYKGWHRYEYSSFKGSHKSEGEKKPKTIEVLYCNFKPTNQARSLLQGMNI